ncbi:MAG: phage baseplate protein [Olsenella sp.]
MSTTTASLKLTKPDVNDRVEDTIAALAANLDLLDALLPIGRVVEFATDYDPNAHAPWSSMTWTRFAVGRTTVGAGTEFPLGTTGGEKTHQITIAEMPAHHHRTRPWWSDTAAAGGSTPYSPSANLMTTIEANGVSDNEGGGQAMSLMNPWVADNKWVRTA